MTWNKNLKNKLCNLFQILAKKTRILITIYEADVHTQIQIAAKPPWLYFQVSKTLPPQPRFLNLFIFVLTKSLFQCLECLLLVEEIQKKKYIEISTKNKQLLTTNPQSKNFTIEPKSLQSPNWIFFYSYNLTRNFLWYSYWNLMKWQV